MEGRISDLKKANLICPYVKQGQKRIRQSRGHTFARLSGLSGRTPFQLLSGFPHRLTYSCVSGGQVRPKTINVAFSIAPRMDGSISVSGVHQKPLHELDSVHRWTSEVDNIRHAMVKVEKYNNQPVRCLLTLPQFTDASSRKLTLEQMDRLGCCAPPNPLIGEIHRTVTGSAR